MGNRKSEIGSRKSEVGSRKSEVRNRRSEESESKMGNGQSAMGGKQKRDMRTAERTLGRAAGLPPLQREVGIRRMPNAGRVQDRAASSDGETAARLEPALAAKAGFAHAKPGPQALPFQGRGVLWEWVGLGMSDRRMSLRLLGKQNRREGFERGKWRSRPQTRMTGWR